MTTNVRTRFFEVILRAFILGLFSLTLACGCFDSGIEDMPRRYRNGDFESTHFRKLNRDEFND